MPASQANSFIIANLRVDLQEVYEAGNYKVSLYTDDLPTTGNDADEAVAWLGVFLDEYQEGIPFSGKFVQVGISATRNGIRWFVYAEPTVGVTCFRGEATGGHCYGDYDDLVSLATWQQVELWKSGSNTWYAYVYDNDGAAYLVARFHYQSPRIYLARSDTEEVYVEPSDPFITLRYFHHHPKYVKDGAWTDWPESDKSGENSIYTDIKGGSPREICATHYGAQPNIFSDPWVWFAGSGGILCEWRLFPGVTYLPDVKSSWANWDSEIIIRNDGSTNKDVTVSVYNPNGTVRTNSGTRCHNLQPNESCRYNPGLTNFRGTAIVDAGHDVSVVVIQEHTNPETWAAYAGVQQDVKKVHVPVVHRNNSGWNSQIYIQNTWGLSNPIDVYFYPWDGHGNYCLN